MPGVMGIIQIRSLCFPRQDAYSLERLEAWWEMLFNMRHTRQHLIKRGLDRAWRLRGLPVVPGIVDGLLEEEMAPEDLSNCFQKKMNLKNSDA